MRHALYLRVDLYPPSNAPLRCCPAHILPSNTIPVILKRRVPLGPKGLRPRFGYAFADWELLLIHMFLQCCNDLLEPDRDSLPLQKLAKWLRVNYRSGIGGLVGRHPYIFTTALLSKFLRPATGYGTGPKHHQLTNHTICD